jgi:hypothetical protein
MFEKEIVTLMRTKCYLSALSIRNEVRVTIEALTFLRNGITKMEV